MGQRSVKVVVTGAAGQIGYALLFRLASGAMFGPEVSIDLSLLEITPALPVLDGVKMELEDCAFPLLNSISTSDDPSVAMKDVNWAILIGSMPRKAGMERSDLLEANAGIFSEQGRVLNEVAASDVNVFVVGNPCNTNALIAMNHAPDIPNNRFYAMTMLDENRARYQLGQKGGAHVDQVTDMIIWGNHSATQFPDFYHAKINGQLATEVITDHAWLNDTFIPLVQKRGAAIIQARGASSAASAANAIIDSVFALNSNSGTLFSVASCSTGQYGVDDGLIFSFPSRMQNGVLVVDETIEHSEAAQALFNTTLDELRAEKAAIEVLKLI